MEEKERPHINKDIAISSILAIGTFLSFILLVYFVYFHYMKKRRRIRKTKENIRILLNLLEPLSINNERLHEEIKKAIKEFQSCR